MSEHEGSLVFCHFTRCTVWNEGVCVPGPSVKCRHWPTARPIRQQLSIDGWSAALLANDVAQSGHVPDSIS